MKNLLLKSVFSILTATLMLTAYTAKAQQQKYAYVDTQYILDNIPEFQDAQDELDEYSKKWQKEIEDNYGKVSEMYQKYQAEAVLLPEDIKRKLRKKRLRICKLAFKPFSNQLIKIWELNKLNCSIH
jgi:Skp family chaperone for outer membrane proteins